MRTVGFLPSSLQLQGAACLLGARAYKLLFSLAALWGPVSQRSQLPERDSSRRPASVQGKWCMASPHQKRALGTECWVHLLQVFCQTDLKHERQGRLFRASTPYRNVPDAISETQQQFWPHQKYFL